MNTREILRRFIEEDLRGLLITDEQGQTLYADEKAAQVNHTSPNWRMACPPPEEGQRALEWELVPGSGQKAYLVSTSTVKEEGQLLQVHLLTDVSMYHNLFRNISSYSKLLKEEKERDTLTGLFNKGKLMEMKRNLFVRQEAIAVYNMDINGLKQVNDTIGHEAGDRLIRKAADSLKAIEARNIMPFRVGGDEFIVVAIHVTRENAENILRKWEGALEALNRQDDGLPCTVACGFAFGEKGFDMEEVFALADQRMYEDKKAKKAGGSRPL